MNYVIGSGPAGVAAAQALLAKGEPIDLDTFDRSGMWINAQDGGFKVIDVTNSGPADRAGLKKGDVIVAVDGGRK